MDSTEPRLPEDDPGLTTLDNHLIVTAVATLNDQAGALTRDQLLDLVEEFVDLNTSRHRSLFHRGFVHALLEMQSRLHFPGENRDRRLWYACGYLFGLLRREALAEALALLESDPALALDLASAIHVPCGAMLLRHVVRPLVVAERFELLARWVESQAPRVGLPEALGHLRTVYDAGARWVRDGRVEPATIVFGLVTRTLSRLEDEAIDLGATGAVGIQDAWRSVQHDTTWRFAQTKQLQGDFSGARQALTTLLEQSDLAPATRAAALCALGLIEGGYRSLAAALPPVKKESLAAVVQPLTRGESHFLEAAAIGGLTATVAHCGLGLLYLFRSPASDEAKAMAADHFSRAYEKMIHHPGEGEAAEMASWTRFLLGLAQLETLDTSRCQQAAAHVQHALDCPVRFPLWLWDRVLNAAIISEHPSLAESIVSALIASRGEAALDYFLGIDLPSDHAELRNAVLERLRQRPLPIRERWESLTRLLPGALRGDSTQAETILDELESLACDNSELQAPWRELLENSDRFSPAWDTADAERALVQQYLLSGDQEKARELLRRLFYRHRFSTDEHHRLTALQIIDALRQLRPLCPDLDELAASILNASGDADEPATAQEALRKGLSVGVLYVGGNETQKQYEEKITRRIAEDYPGVAIHFEFPGWSSNWIVPLERIVQMLPDYEVVVLSSMVRTQFGRALRKACGSSRPWLPCTGKGRESLEQSIRRAAEFIAARNAGNA